MNKVDRPIILHFHIFKNAGTTIDWILKKNFGNQAAELSNPDHDAIINMRVLQYYFELHPNVKSLSSHQFRFPIPQVAGLYFIPIVFVRHPIDRIYSIYHHFRRWEENHEFYKRAKELTLKEFIEWYLQSDDYSIINNGTMKNSQVCFLSDLLDLSQISLHHLDLAIQNTKSCQILGVVERTNESLVLAETILKNHFDNIDLSYISQNVNPERHDDYKKRIELFREAVGDKLFDKIMQNNEMDFQLYQEANAELDKRIKSLKDFELNMSDFVERCKKLQVRSF